MIGLRKFKSGYYGRISTILSNRTTSTGTPLGLFSTPPHPVFQKDNTCYPDFTLRTPYSQWAYQQLYVKIFPEIFRFPQTCLLCIHYFDYICRAYLLGRHISESVFVSFYENVEVFNAKGLRNMLTLVHCICCTLHSRG